MKSAFERVSRQLSKGGITPPELRPDIERIAGRIEIAKVLVSRGEFRRAEIKVSLSPYLKALLMVGE